MEQTHLSDKKYSELPLSDSLQQGLAEAGYAYCTPIQSRTLPILIAGQDVAGQAQTGTGKTAAFLVAVAQHLLTHPASDKRKPNQPRTLILAPTRELAVQIHKDAELLLKHTGLTLGLAYGGANYDTQRNAIAAGVDILVGTPGRLIDYFKQHVFDLRAIQAAVLDEADRMFDLGFIKDVRFLFRRMPNPEQRLSMLFSATLSHRVLELAYEHMNNPQQVTIETESVAAERIEQSVYYVANDEKIPLLLTLFNNLKPQRAIVFVNTKRAAERVWGYLEGNGYSSALLSGDIPQKKRLRLLDQFQQGELAVLVATDVAARGLHIPEVSHVFNFDLPQNAEDYVHRIGRTARAGASGVAISLACEDYTFHLPEIEEYVGHKLPSQCMDPGDYVEVQAAVKREHTPRPNQGRDQRPRNQQRRRSRNDNKPRTPKPE